MHIMIVPPTVKDVTQIPWSEVAQAAIIVTLDGRCLKNRFAPESDTHVTWPERIGKIAGYE